MKNYDEFLDGKRQLDWNDGFDPLWLPDSLFDFQLSLTEWAIRKGRAARCKTFCRFRKKHKCLKHGCRNNRSYMGELTCNCKGKN